jgi:hypothetical protein
VRLRSKTEDYVGHIERGQLVSIVADDQVQEGAVAAFQAGAGNSFDGWRNGVAAVVEFVRQQQDLRAELVRGQFQAALQSVSQVAEEALDRFVTATQPPS